MLQLQHKSFYQDTKPLHTKYSINTSDTQRPIHSAKYSEIKLLTVMNVDTFNCSDCDLHVYVYNTLLLDLVRRGQLTT